MHMDEWSTDELCVWLETINLNEYIPYVFANRLAVSIRCVFEMYL